MNWRRDLDIIFSAMVIGIVMFGLSGVGVARAQTDCDIDCLSAKVTALTRRVVALERLSGVGGTKSLTGTKSATKESYKQIPGGNATGFDWTKLEGSDFTFDQSLYGNVSAVTWQGWIEGGRGSVRLFDSTNGRGVDGSEKTVSSSGRASFYSGNMAIWRGQNQYYIQVKNNTGEGVTVSGARLVIVVK